MVIGFGDAVTSGEFSQCIHEDETIFNDVKDGVELLEKKTYKDTLEAIKKFADAAEYLPKAIKECKASYEAIEKLINAIESFKSPRSFIFHVGKDIIVNHV